MKLTWQKLIDGWKDRKKRLMRGMKTLIVK